MNNSDAKVGMHVMCNGHNGVISRICKWSAGLIEVRLDKGVVCVPFSYPDCYPIEECERWTIETALRPIGGTFGS